MPLKRDTAIWLIEIWWVGREETRDKRSAPVSGSHDIFVGLAGMEKPLVLDLTTRLLQE